MKNIVLGVLISINLFACGPAETDIEGPRSCDPDCERICANSCTGDDICFRHCKAQ